MHSYRESEKEDMSKPGSPQVSGGEDTQESSGPRGAAALPSVTSEYVTALWEIIREVASSLNDQATYKILRTFSRNLPVPVGEEDFESWAAHTQETVDLGNTR